MKLKKKLREIEKLKQRPQAELDGLQLRKLETESEVLEKLREMGVEASIQ